MGGHQVAIEPRRGQYSPVYLDYRNVQNYTESGYNTILVISGSDLSTLPPLNETLIWHFEYEFRFISDTDANPV